MAYINWLDVLIILVLIGGMFLGFWQGVVRHLLVLGAFYAAIVLSSNLYPLLAQRMVGVSPNMQPSLADVLAFFILMFVLGLVLTLLLMDMLRAYTQKRVGGVAHALGGVAGLVIAAMLVSVVLVAISFVTLNVWPQSEGLRQEILTARNQSNIVAVFRQLIPPMMGAIRFWGGNLPPLFSVGMEAF